MIARPDRHRIEGVDHALARCAIEEEAAALEAAMHEEAIGLLSGERHCAARTVHGHANRTLARAAPYLIDGIFSFAASSAR